ncbi:hypothetical protein SERLA73DRAFT_120532 [Serpula lacrymans var. lacrymans S7.3]|uniref:TspO/MBR-related protein n=2 Tax=Serpula lacrymans var. lacrymans TaxID=341189 RepID=F8PP07_SERL3|nr:uncharacterized protein SERLADRAFT_347272 [Serpula lacrymans var. lacrymans S7.9]EGO01884.1 hypothetical protein SERLA73DRAFT_120532 [Serpula lacrymans var. lacrymans S7.3]EGO27510.1 hypothetical protein SERLADRAFT_347272 [Serpula lacrymans var. lacrymans S7.9]
MSVSLPSILVAIPRNTILAVGLPLVLGILSGSHTGRVVRTQWYNTLRFPPGRPPRLAFPIIWPVLYICMGYASHIAVKALDVSSDPVLRSDLTLALGLYYAQLALNCLWSPLFFGARQIGWALLDSIALTSTTFYMTKLLHASVGTRSSILLLPYCVWLSFATYLTGGCWWLNHSRRQLK